MTGSLGARNMRALLAAAAVAIAFPLEARAISLADAMVIAYRSHPDLASARAGLAATDENVIQERAQGRPQVNADFNYTIQTTGSSRDPSIPREASDPFSVGINSNTVIYSGGRIPNAVAAAEEAVNVARANLLATEQQVLLDAVAAFMDVRRDTRFVSLARNNVRVISEQLRAARDRFEVGEVTRTDVSQAEARLASARSILAANTGALARSRQAFLAAIGELPEQLDAPPPPPPLPETEAEAIAIAEIQHPSLRAARFAVEQAEFDVKRAIGVQLPTVSVRTRVGYTRSLTNPSGSGAGETNNAAVSLEGTIPIYSGGQNASLVREAQAVLAQRHAQVHDTARLIRQAVSVAWANLRVSRASIVASRQEIRAAELAFEGVREEAKLGARTTLDVLDAEQTLLNARSNLVSAQRDEYVAAYNLLAAIGNLTVRHLGLNVTPFDPDDYVASVKRTPLNYPKTEATQWSTDWRP